MASSGRLARAIEAETRTVADDANADELEDGSEASRSEPLDQSGEDNDLATTSSEGSRLLVEVAEIGIDQGEEPAAPGSRQQLLDDTCGGNARMRLLARNT